MSEILKVEGHTLTGFDNANVVVNISPDGEINISVHRVPKNIFYMLCSVLDLKIEQTAKSKYASCMRARDGTKLYFFTELVE